MKKHRNPLIQRKFEEGYALGVKHARKQAIDFIVHKFKGIENVEGIGIKTMDKIRDHFGSEYFRRGSE